MLKLLNANVNNKAEISKHKLSYLWGQGGGGRFEQFQTIS